MLREERDDLARVVDVLRHAQRQRLDPCRIWNAVNGAMHAPKSRSTLAPRAQQESGGRRSLANTMS
jgi:hypothetical protein